MSNEIKALPGFLSLSPSNPSQGLGRFKFMSDSEIQELTESAAHAKQGWSGDPTARSNALRACSDLLKANRETLENLIVLEVGKPIAEAKGEIGRAISILDYYSVLALSSQGETLPAPGIGHLYSTRVPYGVAGLITPWNFPVAIPIWKAAPALAGGNTVIIKASEYATATATKLIEILSKALPANVLSLVTGAGSQGAKLISLSDVVSFTGSAATGQKVIELASHNKTPVQAEMGGSNPAIVFEDADLDQVVSNLMIGAFSYSGQKCTATRKVITVGDKQLSEELARKLGNAMDALLIGDPFDSQTYIGPLINQDSVRRFHEALAKAKAEGALIRESAQELPKFGSFVRPVLILNLPTSSSLLGEEVFGPMLNLVHVKDEDSAVDLANNTDYGLTASIHTSNIKRALSLSNRLVTGMIKINAPTAGVDFYAPFGGAKDSSFGPREQGRTAIDFYTYSRTISLNA